MKRIFCFVLVLVTVLSLCGCGATRSNAAAAVGQTRVIAAAATPAPTPAPTPKTVYTDGIQSDGKLHVYLQGACVSVTVGDSSFITGLEYYPDNEHMIITMNGKDYVYANVSESLWEGFVNASSKGSYYNKYIKGNAALYVNGYNGSNSDLIVLENVD